MLSAVIRSEHSYGTMRLASQPPDQRFVHFGPLVLETNLLKNQRLQQIKTNLSHDGLNPSSRTSLNGEQPYAWDLLQPRAEMSRHRGAEHCRRFGRLGNTSLLSPE